MGLVLWIICGVAAGLGARSLMPGPRCGGPSLSVPLGVAGALTGGLLGSAFRARSPLSVDMASLLMAVCGTLIVMLAYRSVALRYELAPHRGMK